MGKDKFKHCTIITKCTIITRCKVISSNLWDERTNFQKFIDKLFKFTRYIPFDKVYEINTKVNLFHLNDLCEDEFGRIYRVIKIDPLLNIQIRTMGPTFIEENLENRLIYWIGSTYSEV